MISALVHTVHGGSSGAVGGGSPGRVAQLAERPPRKRDVVGSSPTAASILPHPPGHVDREGATRTSGSVRYGRSCPAGWVGDLLSVILVLVGLGLAIGDCDG